MTHPIHQAMQGLVGRRLNQRYDLDQLIGVGGMGAVFQSRDVRNAGHRVAIKVLRPDIANDVEAVARFRREAVVLSRMQHRNCAAVTDVGRTLAGLRYIVMEFVAGRPLTDSLTGPIGLPRAIDLALQTLSGLEHAHSRDVVHRDIKPDNILLTRDQDGAEVVKLVDFGIARIYADSRTATVGAFETELGRIFGTPQYMSPEQATGSQVDHRADIYATGLVLYEMLAGQPALQGSTPGTLLHKQIMEDPRPLPERIPEPVREVVRRMLIKHPGARLHSAHAARLLLESAVRELTAHETAKLSAAGDLQPTYNPPLAGKTLASVRPTPRVLQQPPVGDSDTLIAERSPSDLLSGAGQAPVAARHGTARPTPGPPRRRRRSVTAISGIDLNNLELEELGDDSEPNED